MEGDFSWMRTGLVDAAPRASPGDLDMMRKIAALVRVLLEQAFKTAADFVKACGRDTITDYDLHFALKYESEAFWTRPFDDEFVEALREEQTHTYETDSDEGDGESGADEEEGESGCEEGVAHEDSSTVEDDMAVDGEVPSFVCVSTEPSLCSVHAEVLRAVRAWNDWQPTDPAKQFLRSAIEGTSAVLPAYELPD